MRIIGGVWRGRRIEFAHAAEVRPTPDRVRETLFNWLQLRVAGSRCLDLYAGSGALGIEALSRGAKSVVFVDSAAAAVREIEKTLARFGCDRARFVTGDAGRFLRTERQSFDIIFLDPPFSRRALADDCRVIAERGLLAPGGVVYLEGPAAGGVPDLPAGWEILRSKEAGEVGYHLARSAAPGEDGQNGADEKH